MASGNSSVLVAPKKSVKVVEPIVEDLRRCSHPTCKKCRKHMSCRQQPLADGRCVSFEEGLAWDHICKT